MKKTLHYLTIISGFLLPLTAGSAQAANFVIDSFTVAQTARDISVNANPNNNNCGAGGNIACTNTVLDSAADTFVGVSRTFQARELNNLTGTAAANGIGLTSETTGQLNLSVDTGVGGLTNVIYNLGGQTFDFTVGGVNDAIEVFIQSLDVPLKLSLTVGSLGGAPVSVSRTLPAPIINNIGDAGLFDFDLFPGVNFTQVNAFSLQFNTNTALTAPQTATVPGTPNPLTLLGPDARINFIQTVDTDAQVPEPTSVLGLGFLAGLGFLRKKRDAA
ncbi:MAG: PEP-CTERM sorting domain-containing protein [Chloroflexaceae bacterium]|nr:PEP-CTERM sorting domain-containing protein [Chloroflexaceae bacterium]